jgi:hypothetical protein
MKIYFTNGENKSIELVNGKDGIDGYTPKVEFDIVDDKLKSHISYYLSDDTPQSIDEDIYAIGNKIKDETELYLNRNKNDFKGDNGRSIILSKISNQSEVESDGLEYDNKYIYLKIIYSDDTFDYITIPTLTFDSLTDEQKESLKGEDGKDGEIDTDSISIYSYIEHVDTLPDRIDDNVGRLVYYKGEALHLIKIADDTFAWINLIADFDDDRILGE